MPSSKSSSSTPELTVDAADMIRLVQAFLTEQGLHESCRVLRQESGILGKGLTHTNIGMWCRQGQWGQVLETLESLSLQLPHAPHVHAPLLANIHEQAILELAEAGSLDLAYAVLRVVYDDLDAIDVQEASGNKITKARSLEQRLNALAAVKDATKQEKLLEQLYGRSLSRQQRRAELAAQLTAVIPMVPPNRLTTLIQQALKWQAYTGQLPMYRSPLVEEGEEDADNGDDDNEPSSKKKKKKRKYHFDLVLGETDLDPVTVGQELVQDYDNHTDTVKEPIPRKTFASIKFGKTATAESICFLKDASGLITGSSDGLIEIWDPSSKYQELRMDLPYQANDQLMHHTDAPVLALCVSNDSTLLASGDNKGLVKVWRVDTGKCLRQIQAHDGAITCLDWTRDASRLLSGSQDGTCREFGLLTSRLLQEFRGHSSYIHTCQYVVTTSSSSSSPTLVITGSSDGTARVWQGAQVLRVLQPTPDTSSLVVVDPSALGDTQTAVTAASAIHTILSVPGGSGSGSNNNFILVPRSTQAYQVDLLGNVQTTYAADKDTQLFVAACISESWLYVATEDGVCLVFCLQTGILERTLLGFALDTTSKTADQRVAELTSLIHHPTKAQLAAFSNDKTQKRGLVTLWK
jgi:WD40 repeat-containing protein SMU1